jgi:membrane protease YdiL (CAAX protease family)
VTTEDPTITPEAVVPDVRRDRFGVELLLVLGVSLGLSGLYSLVNFLDIQTRGGFRGATATLNPSQSPREWVDLSYQLLSILGGLVPAFLALFLLARRPGGPGFGIGLDRARLSRESLQGVGFALLIGLPGLALLWVGHELGLTATLAASGIGDVWYRYPVLVMSGIQNGVLEEIVVVGYLLTRLGQLGWRPSRAILAGAVLRGSYHLYQGAGGFIGNFIMGLIFGWWFQRTKRVWPLIIAHALIDIASFVGYAVLHGRISWI